MTGPVLVLIEHDRGVPAETAYQALALARAVADGLGSATVEAVLIGQAAEPLAADVGARGAPTVRLVRHADLDDYAPEAWGDALAASSRGRPAPPRSSPSARTAATRCSPTWPPSRTCPSPPT